MSGSGLHNRRRQDTEGDGDDKPREHRFNKLYISGGKGLHEDDYKDHFGKFGEIRSIYVVKDKRSGEPRGFTYITFLKVSEAASAMEKLNGRTIKDRTIKVTIATDKDIQGDLKLEEKMLRLFVVVPKTFTDSDLEDAFKGFGDLESAKVIMDKRTGNNKGFGFIQYFRPYHAALAVEQADESFQVRFAAAKVDPTVIRQPQAQAQAQDNSWGTGDYNASYMGGYGGGSEYDNYAGGYGGGPQDAYGGGPQAGGFGGGPQGGFGRSAQGGFGGAQGGFGGGSQGGFGGGSQGVYNGSSQGMMQGGAQDFMGSSGQDRMSGGVSQQVTGPQDIVNYPHDGITKLRVKTSNTLTNEQLSQLFNFCPGFENCKLDQNTGIAYLKFNSPQSAAYAKTKIHGFAYPMGFRLQAIYDSSDSNGDVGDIQQKLQQLFQSPNVTGGGLAGLAETIQKANSLLQKAGVNSSGGVGGGHTAGNPAQLDHTVNCSIPLPLRQPLANRNSEVSEQVFIVTEHGFISDAALRDIFCRFGNLIDAFLIQGKNYGYAKYADPVSAQKAIETLHGQEVLGQWMKVMKSQPRNQDEQPNKKRRFIENL